MANTPIDDLLAKLHKLQSELEREIEIILKEKREAFQYRIEQGKVKFEQGILTLQRRHKIGVLKYLFDARIGHIITAPFIYIIIVPFVLLDLTVTIYQQICFRIYGIPRVNRSEYLIIDRQKLAYLNSIEKINCVYCGYGNGLIEYVREIAALTEQYWCPIKHAQRSPDPHRLVERFVDYGDAQSYKDRLSEIQKEIATLSSKTEKDGD